MTGPPTPAFSQFTIVYSGAGLPFGAVTTHGVTTPVGALGDITDAIFNGAQDLLPVLPNTIQIDEVRWKVGPVPTGQTIVIPVNAAGTAQGGQSPPAVAVLVRLSALDVSGRFHGRFYLPGPPEEQISAGGVIAPAYLGNLQAAVEDMYATWGTVEAEPRVFPASSSDPRIVESIIVQGRVGTQRRRNRR